MYHSLYVIENSSKNLLRTEGIIGTSILVVLLAFFSAFSINVSLFMSHWHTVISQEMASGGSIMNQILGSPAVAIFIFKTLAFLVSAILIVFTISYIRRIFVMFATMQRPDFLTMSFIGQTTTIISIEFALQAVYLVVLFFSMGTLIANEVFMRMLTNTANSNLFADIIQSFQLTTMPHLLMMVIAASYLFIRTFFYIRRYLYSFFDNLFSVE